MTLPRAVHVLLTCLLAVLSREAAAQVRVLRMPVYVSAGQVWIDPDGKLQGVRVKVLEELNARLSKEGVHLQYVIPEGQVSIKQAMQDTVDGKYDAYFGLIYSKARQDEGFVFGKEEIYTIPTVVWTRADSRFKYAGLSSLRGKRVGLVAGYPFLDDVKTADFVVDRTAPDDETNVQKLLDGKVDVIIDNLTRTGTAILRMKASGKITYSKEPFESSRFLVAYNKSVNPELVRKVDAALKAMRDGGAIKRILDEAVYGPLKK
jgi:polar amino acid transport system substrate-binding protein